MLTLHNVPDSMLRFNCPACGAEDSVPATTLIRQPFKDVVLIQGTCDCCSSTRTQWVENLDGKRIST